MLDQNYQLIKSSYENGAVLKKDDRIIKWSNKPEAMKRIKAQTMRQVHAYEMDLLFPIKVPKVLKVTDTKDLYVVEMEMAKGARADMTHLDDNFFEVLKESLSRRVRVRDTGFIQKTKDLLKKNYVDGESGNLIKKRCLELLKTASDIAPVGFAHGDFHAYNINYANGQVYAYDFLCWDSHTTLVDAANLLSDVYLFKDYNKALKYIFGFDDETNKQIYVTFLALELGRHKVCRELKREKQCADRFSRVERLIQARFKV